LQRSDRTPNVEYDDGMRRFSALRPPSSVLLIAVALLLATASPARADLTGFLGVNPTPVNRVVKGAALGAGLVIVGMEVEYANTSEDVTLSAPKLQTFMFNGLLQTPVPIAGFQFYGTLGGGVYHESLSTQPNGDETNFGSNIGGGAKINLAGPLRLRVDYRVFNLHGSPRHTPVQRWYAGINLKFG
jgi:opacity protein-like surface antigen